MSAEDANEAGALDRVSATVSSFPREVGNSELVPHQMHAEALQSGR